MDKPNLSSEVDSNSTLVSRVLTNAAARSAGVSAAVVAHGQGIGPDAPLKHRAAECRSVVRQTFVALRASGLNHRPLKVAEWIVEGSLGQGRLWLFVRSQRQLGELCRFSDSDMHAILHGYTKPGAAHVLGLVEAGIVRLIKAPGDGGLLVVMNPDAARWAVPAVYSAAGKAVWLATIGAQSREFERQLVSREVEWAFPDLPALLADGALDSALACLAQSSAVGSGASGSGRLDAPSGRGGGVVGPGSRAVGGGVGVDALKGVRPEWSPAVPRRPSEIPKVNCREKPGGFGNSEASRTRAVPEPERRTETVKRLNCSGNGLRTNQLLADLREQFARAHGQAEAAAEMERSGRFWRRCATNWPDLFEREVGALRGHINEGGTFTRAAWFMFSFYLLRSIGAPSWAAALSVPTKIKGIF